MIKCKVTGTQDLAAAFKRLEKLASQQVLERALVAGALEIVNAAKENAPLKTGNLRRSLHVGGHTEATPDFEGNDIGGVHRRGNVVSIRIGTDVIYARIQEEGGTIEAKNGPYLRFKTADGRWHTVKSVDIPAHPYLRPALDEKWPEAIETTNKAIRDQLRELL